MKSFIAVALGWMAFFALVVPVVAETDPVAVAGAWLTDSRAGRSISDDAAKVRSEIFKSVSASRDRLDESVAKLTARVSLADYAELAVQSHGRTIWTAALQRAVDDAAKQGGTVTIPARSEPYYLDSTVYLAGRVRILASGAVVRMFDGAERSMFVNRHAMAGVYAPVVRFGSDETIAIEGGRFESWCTNRCESPYSGKVVLADGTSPGNGGNALWYFSNVSGLSVRDVTIVRSGSFAIQVGDSNDLHFRNVVFEDCQSDGIHVNGGVARMWATGISGKAGDDLVALNAWDWEDRSTLNYGSIIDVVCEKIVNRGGHPWFRILPGVYTYRNPDGTRSSRTIDCPIRRIVLRELSNISEIKMYMQPPWYKKGTMPQAAGVGSGSDWFVEDSELSPGYPYFHVGSNVDGLHLRNLTIPSPGRDRPVLSVGPLHALAGDMELFSPWLDCELRNLTLENVRIVGTNRPTNPVAEVIFNRVNGDGFSSGRGRIVPSAPKSKTLQ